MARWLDTERGAPPDASRVEMVVRRDPSELTLRQLQLLGAADTILFDPAVSPAVLGRARADAVQRPLDEAADADLPGLTLILRGA